MKVKVIVKAWIEKDGALLLARRSNSEKHHAGVWSLPGGNIDFEVKENIIEDTAKREIKEEIGIEIEEKVSLVYTNAFIKDSDGSFVLNITLYTKWKSGELKALEDTSEIKLLTLNQLSRMQDLPEHMIREIDALTKFLKV